MKNLLGWLLFIIGVVAAIYFVPQLLSRALATDEPMMTVTSDSMWPVLTRGDLIFIKNVEPEDIAVGSVIVFHHGEGMAVHRVIRIKGDYITTKGDANNKEDRPITYNDVVGRVLTMGEWLVKIPFVGTIALVMNPQTEVSQEGEPAPEVGGALEQMGRYLANPLGFSLLVLLPAVILFSSTLGDVIHQLEGPRAQRRRARMKRLGSRWGEARAKQALRL